MKIKQSIHRGCRLHVALGVLLCLASLQVWGKKGTVEAGQTYNSESDYNTIVNVFANNALLPDTLKNLDTLVLKGMVSRPASVTAPLELARTLTVIGYAGTASGIIAQPASGLTYRHLQVAANDVLLQNLIFAGPNVASVSANGDVAMRASLNANHGGGISFTYNDTLAIRGCKVVGCQAWNTSPNPTRGGAVYVSGSGSCLLIEDTEISHSYNNSASVNGGAITAAMTTTLIMRGANRLLHNKTTGSGAGFDARGNVQIADSGGVYVGNKASTTTAYGGGVFCIALSGSVAQSVSFRKSRFECDTAVGSGGVGYIYISSSQKHTILFDSVSIDGAVANGTDGGGALAIRYNGIGWSPENSLTMRGSAVSGCKAGGAGGVITTIGASTTIAINIAGSSFSNNTASGNGGVVNATGSGTSVPTISLTGSNRFVGNRASGNGGVFYCLGRMRANENGSLYARNRATSSIGGGVFFLQPMTSTADTLRFTNTRFARDSAAAGGVAYFNITAANTAVAVALDGSQVDSAIAMGSGRGGAFYYNFSTNANRASSFAMHGSEMSHCRAGGQGGALSTYVPIDASNARRLDLLITDSELRGNLSLTNGGAVYTTGITTLSGANYVVGNTSSGSGGAFHCSGTVQVNNDGGAFANNRSSGNGGVFYVSGTSVFSFKNTRIACDSAALGGVLSLPSSSSSVIFDNCRIDSSVAIGDGGVLYYNSPDNDYPLSVTNSSVSYNKSGGDNGGGFVYVYNKHIAISLDNSTFEYNTSRGFGGVINNIGGITTLNHVTMRNNSAIVSPKSGGAIYGGKVVLLDGNTFSHNKSFSSGGAIFTADTLRLQGNNNTITHNSAQNGGGLYINSVSGVMQILGSDNIISHNRASIFGGGLYALGQVMLGGSGNVFERDTATSGGAIYYSSSSGTMRVSGASFERNVATTNGGAMAIVDGATAEISGSAFVGNRATTLGGAIYAPASLTLADVSMTDNMAEHGGAVMVGSVVAEGAFTSTATFTLRGNSSLLRNRATAGNGGAILSRARNVVVEGSAVFAHNKASMGGGAISAGPHFTSKSSTDLGFDPSIASSRIAISGATFKRDTACGTSTNFGGGGGAMTLCGKLTMTNVWVDSCVDIGSNHNGLFTSKGGGGMVVLYNDSIKILSSRFTNNRTLTSVGGSLHFPGHPYGHNASSNAQVVILDGCEVSGSTAPREGGGIAVSGNVTVDLQLHNTTVANNSTPRSYGGGLWVNGSNTLAKLQVSRSVIANNSAAIGGGLWCAIPSNIEIRRSLIEGNIALRGNGGGIYLASATPQYLLEKNTLTGNRSFDDGGGLYAAGGSANVRIAQNTFAGNVAETPIATRTGGGMHLKGAARIVLNTVASNSPSGIYLENASTDLRGNLVVANALIGASKDLQGVAVSSAIDPNNYNMVGQHSTATLFAHVDAQGNPMLADNGGTTPTLLLRQGSPAQNVITKSKLLTAQAQLTIWQTLLVNLSLQADQRDSARLQGRDVDLGASERDISIATGYPRVRLHDDTVCEYSTFDLHTLIEEAVNVRDTLFFRDANFSDTIGEPRRYEVLHTRIYIRFTSFDNVDLDTFVNLTLRTGAHLNAGNVYSLTYCGASVINLNEKFSGANPTDTLKVFADKALSVPLSDYAVRHFSGAGTYYVCVTAANGCTSQAQAAQLMHDSTPVVLIEKPISGVPELCYNSDYVLAAEVQHGDSLRWGVSGGGHLYYTSDGLSNIYYPSVADQNQLMHVWLEAKGEGSCAGWSVADTIALQILPYATQPELIIMQQPEGEQPICGVRDSYRVAVVASGNGSLHGVVLTAIQPPTQGFKVESGTRSDTLEYPLGTVVGRTPPHTVATDGSFVWTLNTMPANQQYSHLSAGDTMGFSFATYNDMCSFVGGSYLTFQVSAQDACGMGVRSAEVQAAPIVIAGMPSIHYNFVSHATSDTIYPCDAAPTKFTFVARRDSSDAGHALASSAEEEFFVQLPAGFSLVPGSYNAAAHNAPVASESGIVTEALAGGVTQLHVPMKNGLANGDSSLLEFNVVANNSLLSCGAANITCGVSYIQTAICNGITCSQITNNLVTHQHPLTIEKSQLSVGAAQVNTYRGAWRGSLPLLNEGASIAAGETVQLHLYADNNNNGIVDAEELSPIDSVKQTLTTTWFADGSTRMFSFNGVPLSEGKQLVAVASLGSGCLCSEATRVVSGITAQSDTVCQHVETVYHTTADRSGYSWQVSGGTIVSGGNTSAITVRWTQTGNCVVTASYAGAPNAMTDTVWVKPAPTLQLLHDMVSICADTFADLRNEYAGLDSIGFFASRSGGTALTGDALHKANSSGWYYAIAIATNGCASLTDSLRLAVDPIPTVQIVQPTPLSEPCYQDAQPMSAMLANANSIRWSTSGAGSVMPLNAPSAQYLPAPQDSNRWVRLTAVVYGSGQCALHTATDTTSFFVRPRPARLEASILTQPKGEQDLCSDTMYELLLTAYGDSLSGISIGMSEDRPGNFAPLNDTTFVEYPYLSGQWTRLAGYISGGDGITWTLPSGLWLRRNEQLRLRTRVASRGCEFVSGSTLTFEAKSYNACGNAVSAAPQQSMPFVIAGSDAADNELLQVETSATPHQIDVCSGRNMVWLTVKIKNSGPQFTTARLQDMVVYMPSAFNLQADSLHNLYNADTLGFGTITQGGSAAEKSYRIPLLRGEVAASDSLAFRVGIEVSSGQCDSALLRVELQNRFASFCNGVECSGYRPINMQPQSNTVLLSTYNLSMATIRDANDNTRYPINTHSRWSGRVVVRNGSASLYTGDIVRLVVVCDANNNSVVDPDEFDPQQSVGYANAPMFELRRRVNRTVAAGDTLQFAVGNLPFVVNHQMLFFATSVPACFCELTAAPISAIAGGEGDSVCQSNVVRYSTTPGMSSYVWTCIGGTQVAGGNGSDYIDVQWTDVGVGTLTVSYRDTRPGAPSVQQARRRITVLATTSFALTQDSLSICEGEQVNLANLYQGAGTLQFYRDRNLLQPLPSNAYSVSEGGWYYANARNSNGCVSQTDSVFVTLHNLLPKPVVAGNSERMLVVGDALELVVTNPHPIATYRWTYNGTDIGDGSTTYSAVAERDASGTYAVMAHAGGYCASLWSSVQVKVISYAAQLWVVDDLNNGQSCRDGFARQGERLTYTVQVSNTGLSEIGNLRIEANVPRYTDYLSGGTLNDDNKVVFTSDNIPPEGTAGAVREFSFVVRVRNLQDVANGTPLSSLAHVFADSVAQLIASCTVVDDGKCPYDPRMGEPYPTCFGDSASIGFKLRKVVCSNIITPNGDGENDCFFVRDIAQYASATLTVTNRWGSVVYASKNYLTDCWDGGGLNGGVYFYTLVLRESAGAEEERYSGYVHVIK